MHYTVFVLPPLLICLTKQAFGPALPLPGHGPEPRTRDAKRMSMASRTLRTGTKRAVFTSLDIRGYIRKYSHWTEEEYLSRRIDLSPFHGAEESQEKKKQKWSICRSWPCKATTDDEHCTKFSSVHEHGYTWIHWISPPMDRGRIVLREKVTENAPLATLFEEEAQEKPEVDCVLEHEPARRNKKIFTYWQGRLIQFCNSFFTKMGWWILIWTGTGKEKWIKEQKRCLFLDCSAFTRKEDFTRKVIAQSTTRSIAS